MSEFIQQLPEFASVFVLMLGSFLIGYITAYLFGVKSKKNALKKFQRKSRTHATATKNVSDIDTIFTEIKPKIIQVVKETQKLEKPTQRESSSPPSKQARPGHQIAESARESYLNYNKKKPELNFDNFGRANPQDREDLTKINGIGPYIEQRLNEIGIYNYDQISRFKKDDIEILTELIDFFPGRIERDDWIGQASSLIKY